MKQYRWLAALIAVGALLFASSALANPKVLESVEGSGQTCPDGVDGWSKTDGSSGSILGDFGTISWPGSEDYLVAYSINAGYVVEVCIKDGRGRITYEITGVLSGEISSLAGSGAGGEVSHVSYRVTEEPTKVFDVLTVTKTAAGAFETPVEWELAKAVEPDFFSGGPGDEWFPVWTVTVTRSLGDAKNFSVTGGITVTNPNEFEVGFTISDVLDDDTVAVVTCPTLTAPAAVGGVPGTVQCTYVATPDDAFATENEVTITWFDDVADMNKSAVATDGIDWVGTETGQLVADFWDPYAGIDEEDAIELDASTTIVVDTKPVECTDDLSKYTDGFLTFDVENVAFLNNDLDLEASAEVTVECRLPALTVVKTADGAFDLPVEWELAKAVEPDFFSGGPGDEWFPVWTVTVTRSLGDAEYFRVTGDITITNPAGVPQDFTVTSDVLNDAAGTEAVVTCPLGGNTGTVPAGESVTCTYVASPADDSADLNTVTVSAAGNDPVVATDGIDWVGTETGQLVADFWDPYAGIDEEDAIELDASTTIVVDTIPVECTDDLSKYTDGFLTFDVENVAFLNNDLDLEASATVTVECRLRFKGETAWAGEAPGVKRYTQRGNWATYVAYEGESVSFTLYAGQTIEVGTVDFSDPVDGKVTIIVTLSSDDGIVWIVDPDDMTLAVQDYEDAPSGNPSPGLFDHKATCSEMSCTIIVPENNFYGVHVNVGYWY